jgi:hypothetical protein
VYHEKAVLLIGGPKLLALADIKNEANKIGRKTRDKSPKANSSKARLESYIQFDVGSMKGKKWARIKQKRFA